MFESLKHFIADRPPAAERTWLLLRGPVRACDGAVTGTTRRWLRKLPARRRPLRLCALYPRVANQIAWHWSDPQRCASVLDELLVDRRGGRRGFPAPVQRELKLLQEYQLQHGEELKPEGFWARAARVSGLS